MDDQPDDKLMTTREVADYLRRTPDTVRRWAKRGLLRSAGRLPDGAYLFRMEDVEALLKLKRPASKEQVKEIAAQFAQSVRRMRANLP